MSRPVAPGLLDRARRPLAAAGEHWDAGRHGLARRHLEKAAFLQRFTRPD